jgi:hypothetical protein
MLSGVVYRLGTPLGRNITLCSATMADHFPDILGVWGAAVSIPRVHAVLQPHRDLLIDRQGDSVSPHSRKRQLQPQIILHRAFPTGRSSNQRIKNQSKVDVNVSQHVTLRPR